MPAPDQLLVDQSPLAYRSNEQEPYPPILPLVGPLLDLCAVESARESVDAGAPTKRPLLVRVHEGAHLGRLAQAEADPALRGTLRKMVVAHQDGAVLDGEGPFTR